MRTELNLPPVCASHAATSSRTEVNCKITTYRPVSLQTGPAPVKKTNCLFSLLQRRFCGFPDGLVRQGQTKEKPDNKYGEESLVSPPTFSSTEIKKKILPRRESNDLILIVSFFFFVRLRVASWEKFLFLKAIASG